VVGHPGRDFLWILSRTPAMDEATYVGIETRLKAQGYETTRLRRTLQIPAPAHSSSLDVE
jgi:apolipoprotein D and lipocalin family protein